MGTEALDYAGFVKLVIDALEASGVDYLIGGAVAAWAWGEPRATQDLDVVVDIPLERAKPLSEALEERGMHVPTDILVDIILEGRADVPINAIHAESGFKAELFPLREGDELRRSALKRRQLIDLGPQLGQVFLHSAEDLILYKLWYFGLGQQTKHLRDVTSIVLSVGDELDTGYIETWAERKGLQTLWKEILARIRF